MLNRQNKSNGKWLYYSLILICCGSTVYAIRGVLMLLGWVKTNASDQIDPYCIFFILNVGTLLFSTAVAQYLYLKYAPTVSLKFFFVFSLTLYLAYSVLSEFSSLERLLLIWVDLALHLVIAGWALVLWITYPKNR